MLESLNMRFPIFISSTFFKLYIFKSNTVSPRLFANFHGLMILVAANTKPEIRITAKDVTMLDA